MSEESKDNIIRGVYYDAEKGVGSVSDTYKQAHHLPNTITVNDVKELLSRQK